MFVYMRGKNKNSFKKFFQKTSSFIFLVLFSGLIFAFASSASAATYYVDATSGNDSNNGLSQSSAWKTINKVNTSSFNPGDSILFKRGEVWREQLTVPSSGSAGNPITFGAYGSGDRPHLKPTVDAGDQYFSWGHYSGSGNDEVWKLDVVYYPRVLWLDDYWVTYDGEGDAPVGGRFTKDAVDLTIIYYNPSGSADPNTLNLDSWGGSNLYAVNIDGKSYIDVENLQVSHAVDHGILVRNGSTYVNVRNCDVSYCGNPTAQTSGLGNDFDVTNTCSDILFEDCIAHHAYDVGFAIEGLGGDPSNITFRRCTSYNNGYTSETRNGSSQNGFSFVSTVEGHYVNNVIVENCISHSNGDHGYRTWRVHDLIIRYSKAYNNRQNGVNLRSNTSGKVYYNLIYGNNQGNNSGGIDDEKSGNLEIMYPGGTETLEIYNNVIYGNIGDKGSGIHIAASPVSNLTVKNNIIYGNSYMDLRVHDEYGSNVVFDNNLYSNTNGSSGYIIGFEVGTPRYYAVSQFSTYQSASGQDSYSLSQNPLFVNPASADFHLQSTSPAIDKGIDVGLTQDFEGNPVPFGSAPDIGAYEYTKTYYVATNGNDSNDGLSPDSPWQTIAKVNSITFNPGNTILFKRGCIWREQLTVSSSGAEGNQITFGAYGSGDKPKITGADIATGWTGPDGNGEYYINVSGTVYVGIVNGVYAQRGTVGSLNAGEWGYSGLKFNYKPPVGHTPSEYVIEYGVRLTAITVNDKDYITIENLHVEAANTNWNSGDYPGNIHILLADNIIVQNCIVKNSPLNGVSIRGSTNSIITQNSVSYCGAVGIMTARTDAFEISSNITISYNTISNIGYNHYRLTDDMEGIGINQVENVVIEHNDISYCGNPNTTSRGKGKGIVLFSVTGTCYVHHNIIHDVYQRGISLEGTSDATISYNIIYNTASTADQAIATAWYAGILSLVGDNTAKIYNNIIYNTYARSTFQNGHRNGNMINYTLDNYTTNLTVKNNIFYNLNQTYANGFDYFIGTNGPLATLNFVADNNLIYRSDSDTMINYLGTGYTQAQFANYQSDTGQDVNSISQDPRFTDTANNNFTLQPTSPAIDAGIDVGLTQDFVGNPIIGAPDIGAYEYVPTNHPPVLAPIGNKTVDEGQRLWFTVTATDLDEDILSFSAADLPEGAGFSLLCDLNADGKIDQLDDDMLTNAFGSQKGDVNYNEKADLNNDGYIDTTDRLIMKKNLSATNPDYLFTWSPTYSQAGTYNVTFAVSDGVLNDRENITIVVNNVIRDTTPPTTPIVTDEGSTTTKTDQLYASWTSEDPESGIAEYQYRITQDPATGTIIRDWTSTGITNGTSNNYVTAGGLSLENGKTYYFGIKAKNGAGLDSDIGYSDGITVKLNQPPTFSPIGDKTVTEGQELIFYTRASDPDGDELIFSAANLPAGTEFSTVILGDLDLDDDVDGSDQIAFLNSYGSAQGDTRYDILTDFDSDGDVDASDLVTFGANYGKTKADLTLNGGLFRWTPTFTQAGTYSGVGIEVSDGKGGTDSENITITVNNVNRAPLVQSQSVTTPEDTAKAITLAGTDPDGDSLSYSIVTSPSYGALSGALPNLTYTPYKDYFGLDSFTFKANDALLDSNTATVSISITSVNDTPVANAGSDQTVSVGQIVSFSGAGSSDVDGTINNYSWDFGDGASGSGATTTHTYTTTGIYTVTLTVTDNNGATDTDTCVVTVTNVNVKPAVGSINPSSGSSIAGTPVTLTTTYTDVNGWQDIKKAFFLVNTSTGKTNCLYAYYNQNTNKLYLRDNANTAWKGGFAPGSSNVIKNGYSRIDCSKTTISGSSTTLTINWNVTFKSTFKGAKNMYLKVVDDAGAKTGFVKKGIWTIQ